MATLLLSSVFKVGNVVTYIGAFAIAILIAGRLGGVRGLRQWVLAAILIVLVAIVLVYAFILAVVSQIQGP